MRIELSLVIPTYNRCSKILGLLGRLQPMLYKCEDWETIVVVDGSTDGTLDQIERAGFTIPNLQVLYINNVGRAGARNSGAERASGDVVLFMDDDIYPVEDSIKGHLVLHEHMDAVVGGLRPVESTLNLDMLGYSQYLARKWAPVETPESEQAIYLTACNFSIKRRLLEQLGGFDARLRDSEDLDLAIRMQEKGLTIHQEDSLYFEVPLNDTFAESFRRQREYRLGRRSLLKVNPAAARYLPQDAATPDFLRRLVFRLFSFSLWHSVVDRKLLTPLPARVRYKIYDLIMTGNYYYPQSP